MLGVFCTVANRDGGEKATTLVMVHDSRMVIIEEYVIMAMERWCADILHF